MDAHAIFFWMLAGLAAAGAALIVITPHIVHAAVALIVTLSAVAGLFFLAGAEFLGAMQIMIYVGGTVVLLAFGVMLTARLAFLRMRTTADQWVVAILLAAPLTVILLQSAWTFAHLPTGGAALPGGERATAGDVTAAQLGLALVGLRRAEAAGENSEECRLREAYLLPFELVSVHLVVVMIGAAYLARRGHHQSAESFSRKT